MKRDILEGRLVTPPSTAALLASFAIQCKGHYSVLCVKQREGILHSLIKYDCVFYIRKLCYISCHVNEIT